MKDLLFQPITINGMVVKNRITMPAMHTNMSSDFYVTDKMTAFYAERAKGGVGMITVGYATVDGLAGAPLCLGAHDDRYIPGLRQLAEAIQNNGAKALVQINHGGRYVQSQAIGGQQPVAPSAIASRLTGEVPREMTREDIKVVISSFAAAARRVKKAGYDGVEVLCGTGYLISEFLSPLTNQRSDEYGGSLENRIRFGCEIISAIRQEVGPDYPLLARINGNDFMPHGNSAQDLQEFAQALEAVGVDALSVNVGWHEARVPQIITSVPRAAFAYLALGIRQAVNIPVIAGHRINDPDSARELIANGQCDMVAMARSLIADPQLPTKAALGQEERIRHCVACGQGCFDHVFKRKSIECLCNPLAGHETETPIAVAPQTRKVMVVGGGATGLSAALAAYDAGHEVTLFEQRDHLGGQLLLAGLPPGREEFVVLADDLAREVALKSIKVVLNKRVDEMLLQTENPDFVVLATGGVPITPPIKGVDLPHVVQAWDVLQESAGTGHKVIVIGGGAVGVETAQFLAEKGTISGESLKFLLVNQAETPERLRDLAIHGSKEVTLIEMIDKVGKDIGLTTRWAMMQDLSIYGVDVRTRAKALRITTSGVVIEQDGKEGELQCDTVVLAAGTSPQASLVQKLEKLGIPYIVAGDAQRVGLAFDAIHSGYAAGKNVA